MKKDKYSKSDSYETEKKYESKSWSKGYDEYKGDKNKYVEYKKYDDKNKKDDDKKKYVDDYKNDEKMKEDAYYQQRNYYDDKMKKKRINIPNLIHIHHTRKTAESMQKRVGPKEYTMNIKVIRSNMLIIKMNLIRTNQQKKEKVPTAWPLV
eukprot:TRINITY_DN288_c0_g1_i3.p1 TRINITY_DN288_c0_g1~~TRINITY_DN288_c0_g1_i3.p1  ORF type:complete len:151 (+),score=21.58 TRINITY_DN288_c0_g1_i3:255-707(+)